MSGPEMIVGQPAPAARPPASPISPDQQTGTRPSGGRVRGRLAPRLRRGLIVGVLSVLAVIWLLPIVYMVSVSLRTPADVFNPSLITTHVTGSNYAQVFSQNPMPRYLLNSVIVTATSTLLVVAAGAMFAFAATVLKLRYSRAMFAAILITLMVPMSSLVVPLGALLKQFGWINNYLGLIMPYAALGIPFAVVVLAGFMQDLPKDVFEAAVIDGAGLWKFLTRVVLPMLRPSLIFVAVWQFVTGWNEFFLALTVMTKTQMMTLPLIPQQYSGVYLGNPGALFAILTFVAAPLILLFVAVQRWFVAGLLEGAVKG
jgi:raffinose/stachyose/melibiose transport system permease protein